MINDPGFNVLCDKRNISKMFDKCKKNITTRLLFDMDKPLIAYIKCSSNKRIQTWDTSLTLV